MILVGLDYLFHLVAEAGSFSAKMVFNDHGAIFFPVSSQHSEMKAEGISYADNYKGNALAAMLAPGKIEARFHEAFTDADVARIIRALAAEPRLAFLLQWQITYQGRLVNIASEH